MHLQVSALNEAVAGSVKSVFKPWNRRLDTSEVGIAFLSLEFSFPPPLGCLDATSVNASPKDVVLACCFVLLVKDVGSVCSFLGQITRFFVSQKRELLFSQ